MNNISERVMGENMHPKRNLHRLVLLRCTLDVNLTQVELQARDALAKIDIKPSATTVISSIDKHNTSEDPLGDYDPTLLLITCEEAEALTPLDAYKVENVLNEELKVV